MVTAASRAVRIKKFPRIQGAAVLQSRHMSFKQILVDRSPPAERSSE